MYIKNKYSGIFLKKDYKILNLILKILLGIFVLYMSNTFAAEDKEAMSFNGRKWEIYTNKKNIRSIAVSNSNNIAYCATEGGLFFINVVTGKIEGEFTNISGLINNDILSVIIDGQNRLWIGASDGSISIYNLNDKKWKYIYDIKNSTETNKSINDFIIYGNYIFVATSYGIQKISLINLNFVDAPYYQLGTFSFKTKVNRLAISNDTIFAGTASGIAYAKITGNLNNPSSWSNYNSSPLDGNINTIEPFDGKVFAGSDFGFSYYLNGSWYSYPNPLIATAKVKFAKAIEDKLFMVTDTNIQYAFKNDLGNIFKYYQNGDFNVISKDNSGNPLIAERENGLIIFINGQFIKFYPSGPHRNIFNYLTEDDFGNIWAAGANLDAGCYKFDGVNWYPYIKEIYPQIGNNNNISKIIAGYGVVWALSFGGGATIIYSDGTMKNYNPTNSNLPGIPNAPTFCVPSGGAFDNNGRFWLSFYVQNSNKSLYAYNGDSIFYGFTNPPVISSSNLEEVAVDAYNTKWVVSGEISPKGLYFFNDNNTIGNTNDDVYGFYYLSDFSVDDITDVIVDKKNEVWIASNNGVFIISNPLAAIKDPSKKPAPVKVSLISGGLKVPFTENCRCIAVDVLNHKWIGTESNGVFHLSEDGSTLIEQFNTSNSPITDNKVNCIIVSPRTGKAYFGTNKGLSVVSTDAIRPLEEFNEIICQPNPYILPSNVQLKIDGLVENSNVKIITLTGEVIAELTSPGGRIASWNGLDKNGNLVPSGIYIVVTYNKDGSKVGKGKLAIVRR